MAIARVEVRLLRLHLVEPFAAAHGEVAQQRPLVVVRVETDEGAGWGECEALPEPGYTPEWAAGAFAALRNQLAPRIIGAPLSPSVVTAALADARVHRPMAVAALEQATLDALLRSTGQSFADWLGVAQRVVPAGAVIGLAPDVDTLVQRVGGLVAAGYRRVKVKIRPGWDLQPLRALRGAYPALELQADANGSYRTGDVANLVALEPLGLSCIEQPLPVGDLAAVAGLRQRLGIAVALDESAASPDAVDAVLAADAADVVVVKPARLGGWAVTRRVHDRCHDAGVDLMAGGLLEAGLGRRALAAVAALPGFTLTGDVSPADRWLADDPWPPMAMIDGHVAVHEGPGVAPEPDQDRLDAVTTERVVVAAASRPRRP